MAIGITKVLAILGCYIQFASRQIITQPVSVIICKPEIPRFRIPIKTNTISNTVLDDFKIRSIQTHTGYTREMRFFSQANIARGSNGGIQLTIRSNIDISPTVMLVFG